LSETLAELKKKIEKNLRDFANGHPNSKFTAYGDFCINRIMVFDPTHDIPIRGFVGVKGDTDPDNRDLDVIKQTILDTIRERENRTISNLTIECSLYNKYERKMYLGIRSLEIEETDMRDERVGRRQRARGMFAPGGFGMSSQHSHIHMQEHFEIMANANAPAAIVGQRVQQQTQAGVKQLAMAVSKQNQQQRGMNLAIQQATFRRQRQSRRNHHRDSDDCSEAVVKIIVSFPFEYDDDKKRWMIENCICDYYNIDDYLHGCDEVLIGSYGLSSIQFRHDDLANIYFTLSFESSDDDAQGSSVFGRLCIAGGYPCVQIYNSCNHGGVLHEKASCFEFTKFVDQDNFECIGSYDTDGRVIVNPICGDKPFRKAFFQMKVNKGYYI